MLAAGRAGCGCAAAAALGIKCRFLQLCPGFVSILDNKCRLWKMSVHDLKFCRSVPECVGMGRLLREKKPGWNMRHIFACGMIQSGECCEGCDIRQVSGGRITDKNRKNVIFIRRVETNLCKNRENYG